MRHRTWRNWRATGFALTLALAACAGQGVGQFGQSCNTSGDCTSDFCVGGELGEAPFCSEDCTGKATGTSCGGGQGRCIADFVAWCWLPCTTGAQCAAVNPKRPVCATGSSGGTAYAFATCFAPAAADATSTD